MGKGCRLMCSGSLLQACAHQYSYLERRSDGMRLFWGAALGLCIMAMWAAARSLPHAFQPHLAVHLACSLRHAHYQWSYAKRQGCSTPHARHLAGEYRSAEQRKAASGPCHCASQVSLTYPACFQAGIVLSRASRQDARAPRVGKHLPASACEFKLTMLQPCVPWHGCGSCACAGSISAWQVVRAVTCLSFVAGAGCLRGRSVGACKAPSGDGGNCLVYIDAWRASGAANIAWSRAAALLMLWGPADGSVG